MLPGKETQILYKRHQGLQVHLRREGEAARLQAAWVLQLSGSPGHTKCSVPRAGEAGGKERDQVPTFNGQ